MSKSTDKESLKILIIEDGKGLNQVLAKNFEREFSSYKIVQAFEASEANAILAEKNVDIVLLDMDVADSVELCKKIVCSDVYGKVDVFAIIGKDEKKQTKSLKEIGIANIFQKPIDLVALNESLKKI